MVKRRKGKNIDVFSQLMKRKSFIESTPMSRELKLKRALTRRKKK